MGKELAGGALGPMPHNRPTHRAALKNFFLPKTLDKLVLSNSHAIRSEPQTASKRVRMVKQMPVESHAKKGR